MNQTQVGNVLLNVNNVNFSYGNLEVLKSVTFSVKQGSLHGFLGINGAGKSTLLKLITGLYCCQIGEISLFNLSPFENKKKLSRLLGFLPDKAPLYEELTVLDYLIFVLHLKMQAPQNSSERTAVIDKILSEVELIELKNRKIAQLSSGQKQRVALAQCLIHNPSFIILDEPTVGLDPHSAKSFRDYLKKMRGEKTIFFSSHYLAEVEQLCDEITIIDKGLICYSGSLENLKKENPNRNLEEIFLSLTKKEINN